MRRLRRLLTANEPQAAMEALNWQEVRHHPITFLDPPLLHIGQKAIRCDSLKIDQAFGDIDIHVFNKALRRYGGMHPLERAVTPQLAAVVYDVTGVPEAMAMYFPLTNHPAIKQRQFEATVMQLVKNPNFNLRIWGANLTDVTHEAPPSISYLTAGQIVELLFYRPDMMSRFFSTPRNFNVYMNQRAYAEGGGVAGGCYEPRTESIKLVVSRLYEGFYGRTPGVAPLIHEFGHMLDAFDSSTASMGQLRGLLPGMSETDGELFSAEARELFFSGKRLELERYERARLARPHDEDDIPVGNPYVFQNDREFVAGYLEMFFRNPHYFCQLNPTLFESFKILFNQDPRSYWEQDFDFYIKQNRAVYLVHRQGITPAGLQVFS